MLDIKNNLEQTPVHILAKNNQIEPINKIFEYYPSVVKKLDHKNNSFIMCGNKDFQKHFLKKYITKLPYYISTEIYPNGNMVHRAAELGITDLIKTIEQIKPYSLYTENKNGKTPLDLLRDKKLVKLINGKRLDEVKIKNIRDVLNSRKNELKK